MKAVLINEEHHLYMADVEKPSPKGDEVLIEIHAAALNRADLLQRRGTYPSPAGWPAWMGLEVSGVVAALGEEALRQGRFAVGDRVCALLGGGGYAEYICAPAGMVMPIPNGLSFPQAAALPEAYATSYLNLVILGHLQAGQTVFIPAGASGLASVAIPMAKALGAYVITSVLNEATARKVEATGADVIINTAVQSVPDRLKTLAEEGHPVEVALDCLSGQTLGACLPYVAENAVWIVISTLDGIETTVPLRALLTKGVHLVGSMLRKRSSAEKAAILEHMVKDIWPYLENGTIRPAVYRVLPLEKAEEAHGILERGEHVGKVVLEVRP